MTTDLFASLSSEAKLKGETNDCAVKAIAAATDVRYSIVHAFCKARGRKARCGTRLDTIERTVQTDLGFSMERVKLTRNWTVNQIEQGNAWKDGQSYLVLTSGHMLAVVDGVVHDWSKGSKRRAKMVWRVSPKEGVEARPAPQPTPAPAPRPAPTGKRKWERALEIIQARRATAAYIAEALGVSEQAAKSLIGDLRRMGYKIDRTKAGYKVA